MGTQNIQAGRLYIVSTPIGNLEDITLRALRILKEVELVAAEDTRHSKKLFMHYKIDTPLVSFHEYNKAEKTPFLISHLCSGKSLALVSDAGTPGIADPAFFLVREAVRKSIPIVPVPGPSAILAALVISGLPTHKFVFENFLPTKTIKRKKKLESLKDEKRTIVVYESPHRIKKTLDDIREVFGEIRLVLCREMTKKFEEVISGQPSILSEQLKGERLRGEMVLVFNLDYKDAVKDRANSC